MLNEFFRTAGGGGDGVDVAVLLYGKGGDGFAGGGDLARNFLRPAGFDADDDASGDIRVRPRPNHGAEMQFQILAELQAPIGVRQGERPGNVGGDCFAGGVGNIVNRENGDMVADANAPVFSAVAKKGIVIYHLFVFRL